MPSAIISIVLQYDVFMSSWFTTSIYGDKVQGIGIVNGDVTSINVFCMIFDKDLVAIHWHLIGGTICNTQGNIE